MRARSGGTRIVVERLDAEVVEQFFARLRLESFHLRGTDDAEVQAAREDVSASPARCSAWRRSFPHTRWRSPRTSARSKTRSPTYPRPRIGATKSSRRWPSTAPRLPRTSPRSWVAFSCSATPIGIGALAIVGRVIAFGLVIAGTAFMPAPQRAARPPGPQPSCSPGLSANVHRRRPGVSSTRLRGSFADATERIEPGPKMDDCRTPRKERGRSMMTEHPQDADWNVAEWQGKMLIDRDGEKIGRLQDVYVDVENDEPQFATVKEGFIGRHLTFVPLGGITVGPDEPAGRGDQGTDQVGAEHRAARRGALPGRRVSVVPPLRAQLHPARHRERTPTRPSLTPRRTADRPPQAVTAPAARVHQAPERSASTGSVRPPALRLVQGQGQGLRTTAHQHGANARAPTSLQTSKHVFAPSMRRSGALAPQATTPPGQS